MKVFAIDPGNEQSAYCIIDDEYHFLEAAKLPNKDVMEILLQKLDETDVVVIERMMSYGMAVGETTFISCEWIGRFSQEAEKKAKVEYIYRKDEKVWLCNDMRAKDANIRAALIERFAKKDKVNGRGTKKDPDVFYGFKADMWSAAGIATTFMDMQRNISLKERERSKNNV